MATLPDRRNSQEGFTLLEVLVAMSILVVGATAILGIFLVAVRWQSDRREASVIADLRNHALAHAEIVFNAHDPTTAKTPSGAPAPLPPPLLVDLRDPDEALRSPDRQVVEAARRFPGCKYEVRFEKNLWESGGASVIAHVRVWGPPSEKDLPAGEDREVLTRSGTPVHAFLASPSMEAAKREREKLRRESASGTGR